MWIIYIVQYVNEINANIHVNNVWNVYSQIIDTCMFSHQAAMLLAWNLVKWLFPLWVSSYVCTVPVAASCSFLPLVASPSLICTFWSPFLLFRLIDLGKCYLSVVGATKNKVYLCLAYILHILFALFDPSGAVSPHRQIYTCHPRHQRGLWTRQVP